MSKDSIQSLFSYLAFEGYVLRIGLEISLTVIAHSFFYQILLYSAKDPGSAAMISWFTCCGTIMFLDKIILGQPADIFRQAYLCSLHGSFEKALELLNSIGPESNSLVKLPLSKYHLHRAELLTQCKDFAAASLAFQQAKDADPEKLAILTYRYHLEMNNLTEAQVSLEQAIKVIGEKPSLLIEKGRNLLLQKKYWDAAALFKKASEISLRKSSTICSVALAYLGICQLKTGHAEKGLEILENTILQIQAEMSFTDALRPTLAEILCYRSHYLATHRAPREAVLDLKYAVSICSFPYLSEMINEIKEELSLRYNVNCT